ncbi:Thioredoxin [uncultured archaeon]|nr:Thioredoxin [uncultured archaeon]
MSVPIDKSSIIIFIFIISFLTGLATPGDSMPGFFFENNSSLQEYGALSGSTRDFPASPVDVDDRSLEFALEHYSSFVLDCWEIGCYPCKLIDPTIDEMARDLQGKVVFGRLCIDSNEASKEKYVLTRTPTLLIFKNGTLVGRHVGNLPKIKLEDIILAALDMR